MVGFFLWVLNFTKLSQCLWECILKLSKPIWPKQELIYPHLMLKAIQKKQQLSTVHCFVTKIFGFVVVFIFKIIFFFFFLFFFLSRFSFLLACPEWYVGVRNSKQNKQPTGHAFLRLRFQVVPIRYFSVEDRCLAIVWIFFRGWMSSMVIRVLALLLLLFHYGTEDNFVLVYTFFYFSWRWRKQPCTCEHNEQWARCSALFYKVAFPMNTWETFVKRLK